MIFAGDLYQYPPVCGTPLYNPIAAYSNQTNDEITKRLGQLAWKTINSVITFTEQEHMKGDHEYAEVVTRLWMRNCTLDDVDLFNSTIIQSAEHENGINMSEPYENDATSIVDSNISWEILNLWKAQSNCVQLGQILVMSAAVDKSISGKITESEQHQLLNMDISSSKLKQTLPGFIPLYIGMPIVLYIKNTSTELGIANDAQGVLKNFYTKVNDVNVQLLNLWKAEMNYLDSRKGNFPFYPFLSCFQHNFQVKTIVWRKLKSLELNYYFNLHFHLLVIQHREKLYPKLWLECIKVNLVLMLLLQELKLEKAFALLMQLLYKILINHFHIHW